MAGKYENHSLREGGDITIQRPSPNVKIGDLKEVQDSFEKSEAEIRKNTRSQLDSAKFLMSFEKMTKEERLKHVTDPEVDGKYLAEGHSFRFNFKNNNDLEKRIRLGKVLPDNITKVESGGRVYTRGRDGEFYVGKNRLKIYEGTEIIIKQINDKTSNSVSTQNTNKEGVNENKNKGNYLEFTKNYAVEVEKKFGIPRKVLAGMSCLESKWGKSGLATKANNYFGVKAYGKAPFMVFKTTEYIKGKPTKVDAKFRHYSSPEESYNHYAEILTNSSRYKDAFKYKNDPYKFAFTLAEKGYATANPHKYAKAVVSNAKKFDKVA